jgi:hypothetical protein
VVVGLLLGAEVRESVGGHGQLRGFERAAAEAEGGLLQPPQEGWGRRRGGEDVVVVDWPFWWCRVDVAVA